MLSSRFRRSLSFSSRASSSSNAASTSGPAPATPEITPFQNPPRYSYPPHLPLADPDDDTASTLKGIPTETSEDSRSVFSFESNQTSPTYTTVPREGHSVSSAFGGSQVTLTNPPRYSTLLGPRADVAPIGSGPQEFRFPVRGGFKNSPWATLCLYNAETVEDEGPIRFPPHSSKLHTSVTPFDPHASGTAAYGLGSLDEADEGNGNVSPFDVRTASYPQDLKGKSRATDAEGSSPTQASTSSSGQMGQGSSTKLRGFTPVRRPPSISGLSSFPPRMYDPQSSTSTVGVNLPQSFLERDVTANVRYELILQISTGRFSENRVKAPLIYTPITRPPPTPLPRQISYANRAPLPLPKEYPECWHQLETTYLQNTFPDIGYTLYLANPLAYARGTVIPCALSITCNDDIILASAPTPRVHLMRTVRFHRNEEGSFSQEKDTTVIPGMHGFTSVFNTVPPSTRVSKSAFKLAPSVDAGSLGDPTHAAPPMELVSGGGWKSDHHAEMGSPAVWWEVDEGSAEPNSRLMLGEIHLAKNLHPTCTFPFFSILYRVELVAARAQEGLSKRNSAESGGSSSRRNEKKKAEEGSEQMYTSQELEIVTDLRKDEPFPISFAKGRRA